MNIKRLRLLMLVSLVLTGCTRQARLYPVQGPVASQQPAPVLIAKFSGSLTSGNMSLVLSDGEKATGTWNLVRRPTPAKGQSVATAAPDNGMPAVWDSVYGQGYYVAHVLGSRLYVQSTLTGEQGTKVFVELHQPFPRP